MPHRLHLPVLLTFLSALCSCRGSEPPSLVLISVTGWPAASSSELPPTPRLDALALGSVSCPLEVSSTDLHPGLASLQTGRPLPEHGLLGRSASETLEGDVITLAQAAERLRIRTAAMLSSSELAARAGLDRGFDTFLAPPGVELRSRDAAETVAAARRFVGELAPGDRFYLWIEIDARDGRGSVSGLAAADAAIGSLLDHLLDRGRDQTTAVMALGALGEPLGASLLEAQSTRVRFILRPPAGGTVKEACPGSVPGATAAIARLLALEGLPEASPASPQGATGAQHRPQTWATARRFGLDPIAEPSTPALPLTCTVSAEELALATLPAPILVPQLTRLGGAEPREFAAAVRDQELAAYLQRHGALAEARSLYERALASDPLAVEALVETARALATTGNASAAEDRLRAALPSYRARGDIYHALAHTSFLRGAHEPALACSRVAACFLPADADVAFDIAVNLAALSRREEALAALARAVDRGFKDRRLLTGLPALEGLRSDPRFQEILGRVEGR